MWRSTLLVLAGCSSAGNLVLPVAEPPPPIPVTDPGPVTPPDVVTEDGGEQPVTDAQDWLFDKQQITPIEIILPPASYAGLESDPYVFVPGDVIIDGMVVAQVGVRLRGKLGSFREIDRKPKFKIDFNKYVEDQRFFELETLALNNSVVDCSYMREALGYRIYEEAGLPVTRVGFASVTLNGEDYGLYQIVEYPDDRWLRQRFDDGTGNLYDGKYYYDPEGGWWWFPAFQFIDFRDEWDDLFQLEEGVDVGLADVFSVTNALDTHGFTADFYAETELGIAWEHWHKHFAGEIWIDHGDGYALNQNNYRIYMDPGDGGRAKILPWDLDYSFPDEGWADWEDASGRIAETCFADPACLADQQAAIGVLLDHLATVDLQTEFAAWVDLTLDTAIADPKRECDATEIVPELEFLRDWIDAREDQVRADWGL